MKRRGFLWGLLAAPTLGVVPALASIGDGTTYRAELLKQLGLREEWRQILDAGMFAPAYVIPSNAVRHPLLLESEVRYQSATPPEFLPNRV